jgi:RimJ/RimL family protein N-acetyltransferase
MKKSIRKRKSAPYIEPHLKRNPIDTKNVKLIEGTGTNEHGGSLGGHYWHIYVGGERAGYVYINIINDKSFGEHPSIQIFLNKSERGKQIGRVAYRLAAEQSGYDIVYAHMRKSNVASIRAAAEAGFKVVTRKGLSQLSMSWRRKKPKEENSHENSSKIETNNKIK